MIGRNDRLEELEAIGLSPVRPLTDQPSVEDRVVGELRELIISGQLAGGTRLTQRALAKRLGISPTPVRISLARLEHEGLVEIDSSGRATVSLISREELEEISIARLGLEGLAARLGAQAIKSRDVNQMRSILDDLAELAVAQAVERYIKRRWEFHSICYRASGRERLVGEVERLFWRAERYSRLLLSVPSRFQDSLGFYRNFLRACEDGDGASAERALQEGVNFVLAELMDTLPSEFDGAATPTEGSIRSF